MGQGEFTKPPHSSRIFGPHLPHLPHSPRFGGILPLPTPSYDMPEKISGLALQLEADHPDMDLFQILQLANQTINDELHRRDVPQAAFSGSPSIQ